jgi:hypothetical protein
MPKAALIIHSKAVIGPWIVERKVWALPKDDPERPHGLKYRLFCGNRERCLVRYDNEAGKGDHRHYGEHEESYSFRDLETLLDDFQRDVIRLIED